MSPKRTVLENNRFSLFLILGICLLYFVAYSTLSIVRHNHYESYGYDLGINDQLVWRYSTFQMPITTIDPYPDKTKLVTHIELVYALISPSYWIWSSRKMLLMLEVAFLCSSAIPVYLLAKKKKLLESVSIALLFSYLMFYGIQNAVWFDVHSASFGAAFLMWFLYFLEIKKRNLSILFFFLAITSKENIAFITFFISLVFFIKNRRKLLIFLMSVSLAYLLFVFFIYFPYIVHMKYLYANSNGLLANLNPFSFIDTLQKRQVVFYSLLSYGFLPILSPLNLLPAIADLATYFIIGSDLSGAQGLAMQYRVTLAPVLIWGTVISVQKIKVLNTKLVAFYIVLFALLTQYLLHLPLSYLTKQWFWTEPSGVKNIQQLIQTSLPPDASVVSQNNITPHLSHRDKIYTLYPEKKTFTSNSPCGEKLCDWFRWADDPTYLIVDTSPEWDIRHLLTNRDEYLKGLQNIEKEGIVIKDQQIGSAILYKVRKNPESI